MASSAENVKLGVCSVIFDGVNLGFTKGGVEVEVATTTHEVKVDQFGETPIGEIITGRTVSAKVPLAETTLENLISIMPGAELITDGVKATGTVTVSTAPVNNDSVTIEGVTFTFKTTTDPEVLTDVPLGTSTASAAANLQKTIDGFPFPYNASLSGSVVTITAKQAGAAFNGVITKTGTSLTVTDMAGGMNPTKAKVAVKTGVSLNLLSVAKRLILRPSGTYGKYDFTINKAACPGALSFTYGVDQERIYNADFKGYASAEGDLFSMGNYHATA